MRATRRWKVLATWWRQPAAWSPVAGPSLALVAFLFVGSSLGAQELPLRFRLDPAASRVWFEARANMGGFRGEARQVEGRAEVVDTASWRDARGALELQVASFRTGIGLRDRHLRDEMATDSFPVIRFTLSRIEPRAAATPSADPGSWPVTLHGALTIKRTTREIEIPALLEPRGGGIHLQGELPLRLTDYGIDPPVRLGGLARMRDELTAHFDLLFARDRP